MTGSFGACGVAAHAKKRSAPVNLRSFKETLKSCFIEYTTFRPAGIGFPNFERCPQEIIWLLGTESWPRSTVAPGGSGSARPIHPYQRVGPGSPPHSGS